MEFIGANILRVNAKFLTLVSYSGIFVRENSKILSLLDSISGAIGHPNLID